MTFQQLISKLLSTPAFWTALFGLINAVLLAVVPAFPTTVLSALNAFIAVIAGVFAGQTVVMAINSLKAKN